MSWANELANEFKSRDNKSILGAVKGTVLSTSPLRVSILGGDVVLSNDKLYVCSRISAGQKYNVNFNLSNVKELGAVGTSGDITNAEILKVNDIVLCLPADGGQTFFIIDKVV